MEWQVQEAKQRLSELLRSAHDEGPQIVTRRGEAVAVVIDIEQYRKLSGAVVDFKQFLRSGPHVAALDLDRSRELPRTLDWAES